MPDLKELDRYPYCGHSVLMGKRKSEWQDVEYVLGFFGRRVGEAIKEYASYVEKGIALGKRPELVGGGLIRSLGGWDEVKKMRLRVQARDLLCYWAVAELGIPMVDLAREFDITPAAVSYAVQRGEKTAKERGYQLETRVV